MERGRRRVWGTGKWCSCPGAGVPQDVAVPLFLPRERHWDGESAPPTGSTAGSALWRRRVGPPPAQLRAFALVSPTPPQGGSDTLNQAPRPIRGQDGNPVPGLRCGGCPPGSAGVPPAHVLAKPRPSAPAGSTGNGARTLMRQSRHAWWTRPGLHRGQLSSSGRWGRSGRPWRRSLPPNLPPSRPGERPRLLPRI